MTGRSASIDWAEFLGRPAVSVDLALAESAVRDRCVFIAGAGGSIGSGLARAVLSGRPRSLVLLDASEQALYECYRQLAVAHVEVVPAIGNILDRRFVDYLFRKHRPSLILHAAAYKHVPLMEQNPFSAVMNNAVGTFSLVRAALEHDVSHLVMLSTDKAVNPQSIMGASKRIAEQVVLSHATERVRMNAVRLGNVLGSSGSVVPIFREQAAMGQKMTITHPDAQRYFITPSEAEVAILQAAASSLKGRILVPDCGHPLYVVDLARYIAGHREASIEFIGLRPGDKLREELWFNEERVESELDGGMRVVASPVPSLSEVEVWIQGLEATLHNYNFSELMLMVSDLVPTYRSAADRSDAIAAVAEVK